MPEHDPLIEGRPWPSAIMLQFLSWLHPGPRSYAETMEAWRTSCPRLSVWEDATIGGFVEVVADEGEGSRVLLTEEGRAILEAASIAALPRSGSPVASRAATAP